MKGVDSAHEDLFGRPHTASRPDANAEVEWVMQENRRVTLKRDGWRTEDIHGSEHQIVHEVMQYQVLTR